MRQLPESERIVHEYYQAMDERKKATSETQDATASKLKRLVSGTTDIIEKHYKDGEPCELHCDRHVTHPCERCGRTMARGEATVLEFE